MRFPWLSLSLLSPDSKDNLLCRHFFNNVQCNVILVSIHSYFLLQSRCIRENDIRRRGHLQEICRCKRHHSSSYHGCLLSTVYVRLERFLTIRFAKRYAKWSRDTKNVKSKGISFLEGHDLQIKPKKPISTRREAQSLLQIDVINFTPAYTQFGGV